MPATRGRKKGSKKKDDVFSLTLKEMKFVYEYVKDCDKTQAAIRAGYPARSAYNAANNLLRKYAIRAAIDDERREIRRRAGLTVDAVVSGLWDQADYYGMDASHAARVKAWESLGEIIGIIPDKNIMKLSGSINHKHAHLHAAIPSTDDTAFRVGDLPIELQRQILEHVRNKEEQTITIEAIPNEQKEIGPQVQ